MSRYRKAMLESYPRHCRSYLLLSPGGDVPSDSCWKPVKYEVILNLIEAMLDEDLKSGNETVASFLRQYITTLRRNIVPETEMKQLATKIYLRHRKTLDFIYANKDIHIREVIEFCKEAVVRQSNWCLLGEREDRLVGFLDESWDCFDTFRRGRRIPQYDRTPLLHLDFDLRQTGKVLLNLTLCPGSNANVRERLYNGTQGRYPGIFNPRSSERGGRLRDNHTRLYEWEPVLTESDFQNWDRMEAREKIHQWVTSFMKDDFPEMNQTILGCLCEIEEVSGRRVDAD